jgi:hypothetical protein
LKKLWYVGLLLLIETSYAQNSPTKRSEGKISIFFKNVKTLFSNVVINKSKLKGQIEEEELIEPPPSSNTLIESDPKLQLNQNINEQKLHMIHMDENQDQGDFAKGKFRSVELLEKNQDVLE